jgi:hypothetical protein
MLHRRLANTDPDYDYETYLISVVTLQRFAKPLIIGLGNASKVLENVLADLGSGYEVCMNQCSSRYVTLARIG